MRASVEHAGTAADLPAVRAEQLANQASGIADTWLAGDIADYDRLVESWGGSFRFDLESSDPAVIKDIEQIRSFWFHGDSPQAIIYFDASKAYVRNLPTGTEDGILKIPVPSGGMSLVPSAYTFPVSPRELVRAGSEAIALEIPGMSRDGKEFEFTFVFVWWPEREVWVPFDLRISGPRPTPPYYF